MTPEEFWAALAPLPEPVPITYRLYYGDEGEPLFYSMESLPGNYIEIDKSTYMLAPTHIRVRDGKIVELTISPRKKLVPSDTGTPCDPRNICVVVPTEQPHVKWNLKAYDTD